MKKILLAVLLISLSSILTLAQNTVYFGNLDKKTLVGLGIEGNDVTLSLMEITKSEKYDSFELRMYDMDGKTINLSMIEDNVYHLNLNKKYAHQKDYKLTLSNYTRLKSKLDSQSYVIINGTVYNGAAFAGVLRSLEVEQNLFLKGKMFNISNVSIWNWEKHGRLEMMRFKYPNVKNFRYIRRIPAIPSSQENK